MAEDFTEAEILDESQASPLTEEGVDEESGENALRIGEDK